LLQCYPPPALNNATNGTAFRASLLPLLAAVPSATATTGFASVRSDRAFVRGLCFGDATVPSDCLGCLSAAALNITAGCGATTRRAGIWSAGCFVGYADTGTSSPSEDAFRELLILWASSSGDHTAFYYDANLHHMLVAVAQAVAQRAAAEITGARMVATADATTVTWMARGNSSYSVHSKVRVVVQCARDVAATDYVHCLQDSARAVDWELAPSGPCGSRREPGNGSSTPPAASWPPWWASTATFASRSPFLRALKLRTVSNVHLSLFTVRKLYFDRT
jgi:hypothetical protein